MTSSDNMISKDLRNSPNLYTIKRLFPKDAAKELAHILFESDTSEKDPDFFYKGGLKAGKPKITGKNSHEIILQYWDYDIALQFTRSEIVKTDQYGLYCYEKYAHWKNVIIERLLRLERPLFKTIKTNGVWLQCMLIQNLLELPV